jgi:hypothetical protein
MARDYQWSSIEEFQGNASLTETLGNLRKALAAGADGKVAPT